jgi:hypothetical protein
MVNNIENAVKLLLHKYEVKANVELNLLPGWSFLNKELNDNDMPLLTWRLNRRFIELKKIVSDEVVENVSMLRFCSLGDPNIWSLEALMYREFDLCEFITGSRIAYIHATLTNGLAGNIIVKLENGTIGSVEIGVQVPAGKPLIERHEIIARRGVASDIVVDTQVPQSSIYIFTENGDMEYKDVDNELFGMDEFQVEWVRAAFQHQKDPTQSENLIKQHNHLSRLVESALESNSNKLKVKVV